MKQYFIFVLSVIASVTILIIIIEKIYLKDKNPIYKNRFDTVEYNIGILPCPYCGKQGILTHCCNYEEDSANRVPTCWTVYCETTANDTIVGNSCDYMDNNTWFKTQNEAIIAWNKWCISHNFKVKL